MQELNWKELDSKISPRKKNILDAQAKANDCEYISEMVYKLYHTQVASVAIVSDQLGISHQTLRNWIALFGFTLRPPKNVRLSEETRQKILSLEKTCTIREAAEQCGCSTHSVRMLWQPVKRKKTIKTVADPKPVSNRDAGYRLSTWKNQGLSREEAQKRNRNLEFEAWKAHRGDKHIPLPEKTMRIGEYANF